MKINRLFLSILALAAIAVSCQDEADLALPEISVDQTTLSFGQTGGATNAQTIYVTANRDWEATCDADWVNISPTTGKVTDEVTEVTIYVDPNDATDRSATVTFASSTVYTAITVNQEGPGGSVESTYVYSNDFDASAATQTFGSSSSSWPYLDQFDGWQNETGSGASTVSYNYTNMSVRDNSNSNGSYSNYEGSGTNNLLFGSVTNYFVVQGITLPSGTVNYSLSFGSELYSYDIEDNTFDHNKFHVYISDNGERWVELEYAFPNGDLSATWDLASTSFTVPDGTSTLYLYFTADYASSYRLDDVLLAKASAAGTSIDFSTGVTDLPGSGEGTGGNGGGDVEGLTGSGTASDPYTVADALAICAAGAYTSDNVYISGIIAGDPDIDTSYGNATYYISDDGTEADRIEVFRGYYLNGEKFTSTDQIKAGDQLVVCGQLTMYYETPEITTGSSIYSINGEGGSEGGGEVDLTDPYTTSVTWTAIEHAETNDVVIINDTEYNNVLKLGTGSYAGSGYCTVPSGTKSFVFYCLGWNNKSNVPFTVTVGDVYTNDYTANGNSGVNNNTPFTLDESTFTSSDFYVINLDSALTADTQITITTTDTSNGRVIVFGAKYFDTDQEGGDDNGNGGTTVETEGSGTADDPYTSADAIAICAAGAYTTDNVYVKGIISQIDEVSTSYGNATYYISDDGTTTSQFEIFRGYSLDGAKFTSETEIEVGDKVVVCGVLTNYSGTYEMTTGSSIYSLEKGEGGGNNGGSLAYGTDSGVEVDTDYSTIVTWASGNKAYDYTTTVNGSSESYEIMKLGSGSAVGSNTCTIPAGSTSFGYYVVAWSGKSDVPYQITIGSDVYTDVCQGNSGFSGGNTYYDLVSIGDSDYRLITFASALTEDTTVTVETTATSPDPRAGFFAVKYFPNDGVDDNTGDEVTTTGDGTLDNPYTCADLIALNTAGSLPSSAVYGKGKVSKVGSVYSNQLTYYISDTGEHADYVEIYDGNGVGGESISSTSYLTLGDEVVVYGTISDWYGTPEFGQGTNIITLNGSSDSQNDNPGDVDLADPYNTNVTWTLGTQGYNQEAYINSSSDTYTVLKLGASSAVGDASCTIPAGSTGLAFYCIAWSNKGPAPFQISVGDTVYSGDDYNAAANSTLSGNPTYNLTITEDDYFTVTFDSALTSDTTVKVETTSTTYARVVFIGFRYVTE